MFITGPDVIRTVTHEEVDDEALGGAMAHNHEVGRRALRRRRRGRSCLQDAALAPVVPAPEQPRDPPRVLPVRRPRDADGPRARPRRPGQPEQARTTCATSIRRVVDDGEFFEVQEHYARTSSCGFARIDGHAGRRRRQPARAARRRARHRRQREGGAVRPLLRRFNIPLVTFVDVPGFLPGHEPGVGRDHPPRREAAVRLRRGDRAEDHRHHAQGLRRRLRRHGVQAHPRRLQLRVAHRRDRGHGPRGRGEHRLPPRRSPRADSPTSAARSSSTTTASGSPTPTRRPSSATSTR